MVLMNRTAGAPAFFVITQTGDNLFVIRSWDRRDGVDQGVWSGEPVSAAIGQLVVSGMPVPRDGALLGWLTDSQVTVLLAVHCRPPEPWDNLVPAPGIQVMPLAGTSDLLHWPPFAASPLDGRLWDYVERGQIVDIAPLLTRSGGRAFWVPSPDTPAPRYDNLRYDNLLARQRVHRRHRQPVRGGILAPGRRLPGSLDPPRGHPGPARRPAADPARRRGADPRTLVTPGQARVVAGLYSKFILGRTDGGATVHAANPYRRLRAYPVHLMGPRCPPTL